MENRALLLAYSPGLVDFLGLPHTPQSFYPNILGGVFVGITIALAVQAFRKKHGPVGLGAVGALAINICGALVLTVWLSVGKLDLPLRGALLLWILDAGLVAISFTELLSRIRGRGGGSSNPNIG